MKASEKVTVARPAAKLRPYEVTLIKRRALLKALDSRIFKLIKRIDEKLNPYIDAELSEEGADKATVSVHKTVVEVQRFARFSPAYKEIVEEFLDEDKVQELLDMVKDDGTPAYKTASKTYKSKLVGDQTTVDHLLKVASH